MKITRVSRFMALVAVLVIGGTAVLRAGIEEDYQEKIVPILKKMCFDCHGPEEQKGDLNLDVFKDFNTVKDNLEIWQIVLERVQAFEMPPKKSGELNYHQQQVMVDWLRKLPKPEQFDCNQLASDRTANFYKGYVMSRRLNRAEYINTVRDLVGVKLDLAEALPADGGGGEGFDTTGSALFISTIHIEKYLQAADLIVQTVLPDKTRGLSPEIAAARKNILVATPGLFTSGREAGEKVVKQFARRAFRRPVTDEEVARLMGMFDRAWERGDGFVPSVRLALKAALISPDFLFLAEPEPAGGGIHRLASVPLASKLSYFLWSSMPDEELLTLAENNGLADTNVYRAQIKRMLADPKANALGERFSLQWLEIDRLGREVRPDPKAFPEFTDALSESMRDEVMTYFNHIVREDRSLLELIDSNYSFVNERLAEIYGIKGIKGEAMQQITFKDRQRGGVTSMAAVHALTSFPLRTSPVLRGRWVLEALLGDKVPPPPPDVPALEEAVEKGGHLSVREQLEIHRTKAECAACHDKMDPLGFGLENFDVMGRWRDEDRDQPIDSRGTLPSGETYSGPGGLKDVLMQRKDKIMRHLVRKMTGFAYGRELTKFDNCVVDDTIEALKANDYRASVLLEHIATSFPFQNRFYPKQD